MIRVIQGDCLEEMRKLPDQSVHCCVTSPPYWGLRDYGVAGQLGGEATPQSYVDAMVSVFREAHRALRDDGTLWLNLGDSYGTGTTAARKQGSRGIGANTQAAQDAVPRCGGIAKQLIGIPWRVAFALQSDGWYLRQDIIWAKPNPMPESVRDRCTKSHEYLFLLSKNERYYFDADAIAEPVLQASLVRAEAGVAFGGKNLCPDTRLQSGKKWNPRGSWNGSEFHTGKTGEHQLGRAQKDRTGGKHSTTDAQAPGHRMVENVARARAEGAEHDSPFGSTRNKRSVWTVATQSFKEAHFATFPPALIEPCILAGCPVGGTVLDPFGGAGTSALVADRLGRDAIIIELNPVYADMARARVRNDSPLFAEVI